MIRPPFARCLIHHNVCDSQAPVSRIHVNTWEYTDLAEWMDELHPGDSIVVHAINGQFSQNIVDFVRMDVYCAW